MGFVPDEDLPSLYAGAAAFLFPTRYEGFGLPVLEAMASGAPTVVSHVGAVREITGNHAVFVDPDDPGTIAAGISLALEKSAAERDAARIHAAQFTWDACARATRAVYDDALEKMHSRE